MRYSTPFRTWCRDRWFEHRDEVLESTGCFVHYGSQEYFSKYKYWLKREYQYQKRLGLV